MDIKGEKVKELKNRKPINREMQYLKRRQNDAQQQELEQYSLKSVIEQRQIIIEQQQRKYSQLSKLHVTLQQKYQQLQTKLKTQQNASRNQMLNLNLAIRDQQTQLQAMKHDKSEYQFKINMLKLQIKQHDKQYKSQIDSLKIQYESQKESLQLKLNKLQKNLSTLTNHYNLPNQINSDKLKLIQDTNRDLRGFSNQKHQRIIMIQNQHYANQIEFQAKEIENLLLKNQKLHDELKTLKNQLQLHKQIENDLVKRSSLAQKLIKQLNKRIRQLQGQSILQASRSKATQSAARSVNQSQESSRISSSKFSANKSLEEQLNKLRFEFANLKNHSLYLENMQKMYTQKYETLGAIMAEYLENLIYFREKNNKHQEDTLEGVREVNLDITQLRKTDVKEWKTDDLETVLFLIVNQVRPFLSKNSLVNFPQSKNISISFTEPQTKDVVTLPKIAQNYQKTYEKQANKMNNRFKDIPLDISTKILRSNLREWGTKVSYGSNIPSLAKARKLKSKSIAADIDRSAFI